MEISRAKVRKMETQLAQWGAKLDDLVSRASTVGDEAKSDHRKRLDDLKSKHRLAQAKLDELKGEGEEKWESLKTGIESAWNDLEVAFEKVVS